jgi:hypothetical protein
LEQLGSVGSLFIMALCNSSSSVILASCRDSRLGSQKGELGSSQAQNSLRLFAEDLDVGVEVEQDLDVDVDAEQEVEDPAPARIQTKRTKFQC